MYEYDYGYTDYGYSDYDAMGSLFGGIAGGILIFYFIILAVGLTVWIINLIGAWKVYKKAGKGGWEALIPFYSNWVLVEIAGLNWWWFLLFFAPILLGFIPILNMLSGLASLFVAFNCYYNLAKKFNKGTGFAVCLTLFTPICIPMLGFSKNNIYDASVAVSNNGVFGPSGNSNGNNNMNNNNYNNMNNNMNNNNYNNMNNNMNNYQNNGFQQQNYNNVNNDVAQNNFVQNNVNNNISQDTPIQNETENAGNVNSVPVQEYSFCGNCGTKLNKDAKFCPNCGKQNMQY